MTINKTTKHVLQVSAIILITLLFVVIIGPFLIPIPMLEGTTSPEQLADGDSRFVDINGIRVHYKIMGEGDPVLILLHGFGVSLYSWHAIIEPLSSYGTVIAYDRVAFGLTERPMEWYGQNPYSPEAAVDLLLAFLDYFEIQQAILIGNSAGGTVAMQFALAHAERVQALVLVDAAVYSGGGAPAWIQPLLRTPQMQHLGPLLVRQIQSNGPQFIELAWHDTTKITPDILDGYLKPLQVENWDRALWYFTVTSQDIGLPQRLNEITMPSLVITGDDDRIVPTEQSVRLARELPNASLIIVPQAGHLPHEEQPALFMQAMDEFLNNLLPRN